MPNIDFYIALALNHPLTYIIIIGVFVFLILGRVNQGRLKPEQRPDFGIKYRAKRTKEHLDKREKAFSIKPKNAFLFRDIYKIGKILSIEKIPTNPDLIYNITYRRFGLWSSIKALFGFSKQRLIVDDTNIEKIFNDKDKHMDYVLNDNLRFRERGGVLILSKKGEAKLIDEINADMDYENAKGFCSDFPRRLSNLHPAHAMKTDTMELDSALEEQAEEKKRFSWARGK